MKKAITFLLTLAMIFTMSAFVAAGGDGYRVTIGGNGNNRTIVVNGVCTGVRSVNNSTVRVTVGETVLDVVIHGNSVRLVNVVPQTFIESGTPSVNAGTQNAPNHSSGGAGVQRINNVEIRGNGNSARIWVDGVNTNVRPANNTWTAVSDVLEVFVRGNAILEVRSTAAATPTPTPAPYVVKEYYFFRFVRLEQIESRLAGKTEVANTRGLVFANTHDAHQYHMGQSNDPRTNGVTGNGARITSFNATLTLSFDYQHNYVEQFRRIYEWVDVTVWSDDSRVEVVRKGSEHERGVQDGNAYDGEVRSGSNVFALTYGGSILLHMGNQGLPHQRAFAYGNDLFSVSVVLENTGNPPRVSVSHNAVMVDLPNGL